MNDLIATFIFFFAVIDPLGTVPVFIVVTSRYEDQIKRKIALRAALVSAMVLVFFVVAGEVILIARREGSRSSDLSSQDFRSRTSWCLNLIYRTGMSSFALPRRFLDYS